MASRRCAEWRLPTEKQPRSEAIARRIQDAAATAPAVGPADPIPENYWDSVLSDPRASVRPGVPIQNRRLSEFRGTSCA
jgi:hypothetical protein